MLRGHLKILTLIALKKGKKSGYALMKFLEQSLGQKPSPGSVYPLLNNMLKEKLVTYRKIERKKEYSITKKGIDLVKEVSTQEVDYLGRLIKTLMQTREELRRL